MKIKFDGQDIEVAGLNLNQLCEVEEKFGSLADLGNSKTVSMKMVRFLAFLVVKPHRPELTEEQVGEKLSLEAIQEIAKVLNPAAQIGAERPFP